MSGAAVLNSVKDYYGKVLKETGDLKTNACLTSGAPPTHIRDALKGIHEEVCFFLKKIGRMTKKRKEYFLKE